MKTFRQSAASNGHSDERRVRQQLSSHVNNREVQLAVSRCKREPRRDSSARKQSVRGQTGSQQTDRQAAPQRFKEP